MGVWAIYARVSGIEQAANNSIPTQLAACKQRAEERKATEILEFVDAGVPGDLDWIDRPQLNHLLDLVEKDVLTGVVIYDPDRLARDLGVQLAVTDIISRHRVQLEFVTQQFDASPEGMLFYQLRGAISQFERSKIKERTNRGRRKVLRDGRPANKPMPYGLEYDRQTNTWSIIEDQAAVVRRIFDWTHRGLGATAIARRLNEEGVAPPRGENSTRWWANTVQRMLSNSTYVGRLYLNRYNQEGQRKNRFLPRDRRVKVSERPVDDWIEVTVPAIISEELWNSVQGVLAENRRRNAGRISPHYLYLASRLIRCGVCGSAITGASAARRTGRTAYYRCNGRFGEKKLTCDLPHLRAAELDEAIWQEVRAWLVKPSRYGQAVRHVVRNRQEQGAEPSAAVLHQLTEVRADIARLQDLVSKGAVREHEVRGALRSLRDREASLALKLKRPEEVEVKTFEAFPPEVVDRFNAVERREHVRGIIAEIVAHPDGSLELTPRENLMLPAH